MCPHVDRTKFGKYPCLTTDTPMSDVSRQSSAGNHQPAIVTHNRSEEPINHSDIYRKKLVSSVTFYRMMECILAIMMDSCLSLTLTLLKYCNILWDKQIKVFKKMFLSYHIDGLVQERGDSTALAVELRLSCTNPPICFILFQYIFYLRLEHG